MNIKLFSFMKPSPDSMVASNRVARYVSGYLDVPIEWGPSIAETKSDVLFIVNGAFAFCKCLPEIGAAVQKAKHVVWIQQDYTIVPPKEVSEAQSPFRYAFAWRKKQGLPGIHYWSTVKDNTNSALGAYVNWNMLTYEPTVLRDYKVKRGVYYGSYRVHRETYFRRFFTDPSIPLTISSPSDKFQKYQNVHLEGPWKGNLISTLSEYALGLYLEDRKSHEQFHSPANRFYEMLSAGLPMVFQEESVPMLAQAGYDVTPYVVRDGKDLKRFLKLRGELQAAQARDWRRSYRDELNKQVAAAVAKLRRALK